MDRPDIEAIETRVNTTTEGPWRMCSEAGVCVCQGIWSEKVEDAPVMSVTDLNPYENGNFVANSRTDIPQLIAYVKYLESEVAALRADRDRLDAILAAEEVGGHYGAGLQFPHGSYVACGLDNEATWEDGKPYPRRWVVGLPLKPGEMINSRNVLIFPKGQGRQAIDAARQEQSNGGKN